MKKKEYKEISFFSSFISISFICSKEEEKEGEKKEKISFSSSLIVMKEEGTSTKKEKSWCLCYCASVVFISHLVLSMFLVIFVQKEIKQISVYGLTTRSARHSTTRPSAATWRGACTDR